MTENTDIFRKDDTLFLQGDVRFHTVTALGKQLEKLLSDDVKTLDCSGITHADSSAVSLLIYCVSLTNGRNPRLNISGINKAVRHLVDLYDVNDFLTT